MNTRTPVIIFSVELAKRNAELNREADHWPERESHCILENDYAQIVISEYCGLVSLGVVPVEDSYGYDYRSNLAPAWIAQHCAPFLRETRGQLARVGTFSNGESVYRKTAVSDRV